MKPKSLYPFLEHLRQEKEAFKLRHNGQPPEWTDAALHQSYFSYNPELYALLSVVDSVLQQQRDRQLFQILQSSRQGFSTEVRLTLERVTDFLLKNLPPDRILTVFLALKRVRANHKHSTRAILKYIFQHPQSVDMAICRRPAVVDCLEHAIGKNVARACAKIITDAGDELYLQSHLLKFVENREQVKQILQILYQQTKITGTGDYKNGNYKNQINQTQLSVSPQEIPQEISQEIPQEILHPKTVTATNRGDISATLVHLYRGGESQQLLEATDNYVKQTATKLPIFNGKLAVVFDASSSTRGYGDREYCCLSQSVALKLILQENSRNYLETGYIKNNQTSLANRFPIPEGYTDLATGLLDALETQPDVVAIISDGYENQYPGDLQRVVATLPQIGIETPVVFCHSKFTNQDDLQLRRPANNLPQLEFWHQENFEDVMLSLLTMADSKTEESLKQFLLRKLAP